MKTVKLTKALLDKDLEVILRKLGAVHESVAFPDHVYFSDDDYDKLRNNLKARLKKQKPGMSVKYYELQIGSYLLNLGPNSTAGEGIKSGYALVDDEAIRDGIEAYDSRLGLVPFEGSDQ